MTLPSTRDRLVWAAMELFAIKGYGSTNERGKENLLHVLQHLAHGPVAGAAGAIAAARTAALADDAGKSLDATLLQHGAPARPVKAQPIRWLRQPKGLASGQNGIIDLSTTKETTP